MTGIQTRDSVGDSSDDEPLSKLMKYKSTPERTQYLEETTLAVDGTGGGPKKQHSSASPVSDSLEDASVKKTPKESSLAAESPGHSSDSEPLSTLLISKGSAPGSAHRPPDTPAQDSPDSEDDQPLMTLIKKKPEREATATLDAKGPKKRKMTTRASQASSQSQVKTTQKRGRKGKAEVKKKEASAPSTAENQTPKRRGRPKKADPQTRAPSSDTSDDETLSQLVRKKNQPEVKHAVVLLKRMSKSDVMDAISQGRARSGEQTSTAREVGAASPEETSDEEPLSLKMKRLKWQSKPARGGPVADTSSDNEPLLKQVKTIQGKHKCRERTNGEDDTPKHESKLAGELKDDSDGKCLGERKTDEIPPSPHRESSSS